MAAHLNGPSIRPASKNQNRKFYDHPGSGAARRGWQSPPEVQKLNGDSSMKDAEAFAAALPFKLLILSRRFCLKRLKDSPKLLYVVTIYTLYDRDELLVRSQRFVERKSERLGPTRACSASHVTTHLSLR
jgi:hypothetical protein